MTDGTSEAVDGRRLRREQGLTAVVDALLTLLDEGVVWPSAAEVAERSGVSVRSVFRYFDDLDTLVETAIARHLEAVAHLFDPLPEGGSRRARIERLADARATQYETLGPMARAAAARATLVEAIGAGLEARRLALRRQVEELFRPELSTLGRAERRDLVTVVETATGLEAMEVWHVERGRSLAACRTLLVIALEALVPRARRQAGVR
jgi:AcrR family transcriptional regulator